MGTNEKRPGDGLRAEIVALALGADGAGVEPDSYFERTAVEQIVADLRGRAPGAQLGTTLGLLLRLDDPTLGMILAALRDSGRVPVAAGGVETPPDAESALAESYIENFRMGGLLDAAMSSLSNLLTRMEREGTALEADAGTRPALRVLGIYTLMREEPDSPQVIELIEGLLEEGRGARLQTSETLLLAAGNVAAGKAATAASVLSEPGRSVIEIGDARAEE